MKFFCECVSLRPGRELSTLTPLMLLLATVLGCGTSTQLMYDGELKVVRHIGSLNSTTNNDFFGHIQGIAVDSIGRIYVVDGAARVVKRFDWNGEYIDTIGGPQGFGPGEFQSPAEISIGRGGDVYVADRRGRGIQVFREDGAYRQEINTGLVASPISVWDSENIFQTRWGWGGWDQNRLVKVSSSKGVILDAVAPNEYIQTLTAIGMYPLWHTLSRDETILAVAPYPYEIKELDLELRVITAWPGMKGLVEDAPFLPEKHPNRRMVPLCAGIAISPTNMVIIRIQLGGPEFGTVLDIYDKGGDFISRIPTSSFGINRIGFYFAAGLGDTLVCSVNDPYPSISWIDLSPAIRDGLRRPK